MRVVGDNQEGLPWAQAVIVPLKDDELAQKIRGKSLLQDGSRLDIKMDDYRTSGYGEKHRTLEDNEDEKDLEEWGELIGERNAKVLKTLEERRWFAKYGAWYKSDAKLFSNDQGYILNHQNLAADEHYVLYLWSNSRNDLEPDARVVFKASETSTDLGVIRLPSYR
ncbi:hypothetical protein OAU50_03880 [Planctomycetota bacterium]|nr:hypothetical protein [Planctomycetota bacterium]